MVYLYDESLIHVISGKRVVGQFEIRGANATPTMR